MATGRSAPITDEEFRQACVKGASDTKHIGMLFLDYSQTMNISLSLETFASHIEAYAGVPVLLIKTDNTTVLSLRSTYEPKAVKEEEETKEEKTEETRKGVVEEILPSDRKEEDKVDNPEKPDDDSDKQGGN